MFALLGSFVAGGRAGGHGLLELLHPRRALGRVEHLRLVREVSRHKERLHLVGCKVLSATWPKIHTGGGGDSSAEGELKEVSSELKFDAVITISNYGFCTNLRVLWANPAMDVRGGQRRPSTLKI